MRYGLQHHVIANGEPRGLPLNESIMTEEMSKAGYNVECVGKWHLVMIDSRECVH